MSSASCPATIPRPTTATSQVGSCASPARPSMHHPRAQITPAISRPTSRLKVHAQRSTVSSSSTSHSPRVTRKRARPGGFLPCRSALVPARKKKAGAQKCVIQRVKKTPGVDPPAGTPEKTRTWSIAIRTIARPRRRSRDRMRANAPVPEDDAARGDSTRAGYGASRGIQRPPCAIPSSDGPARLRPICSPRTPESPPMKPSLALAVLLAPACIFVWEEEDLVASLPGAMAPGDGQGESLALARRGDGKPVCGLGQEFHAGRRAELMKRVGAELLVFRGLAGVRENLAFRQDKNFWYLTGVESPGAALVLDGKD